MRTCQLGSIGKCRTSSLAYRLAGGKSLSQGYWPYYLQWDPYGYGQLNDIVGVGASLFAQQLPVLALCE